MPLLKTRKTFGPIRKKKGPIIMGTLKYLGAFLSMFCSNLAQSSNDHILVPYQSLKHKQKHIIN